MVIFRKKMYIYGSCALVIKSNDLEFGVGMPFTYANRTLFMAFAHTTLLRLNIAIFCHFYAKNVYFLLLYPSI